MATSLISRAAKESQASLMKGSVFNLIRRLSTTSAASPAASKPKQQKRKKKNLFEVAQFLPNWGIGYHFAKSHWTNVSYEITKINLYKDGRHGKAWGLPFKDGVPAADASKKISGVHKRCWKYLPSLAKSKESMLSSPRPTTIESTGEVRAA